MSGHHGGYVKLECGYQLKSGGAAVERERYTVWALTRLLTQSGAVKRWTQSLSELIGRLLIVRFMTNCFCPHNNKIIAELRHWFYRMAHTPSHSITSQSTDTAYCLWRCGTNTFIMLWCHWIYIGSDRSIIGWWRFCNYITRPQTSHQQQPEFIYGTQLTRS